MKTNAKMGSSLSSVKMHRGVALLVLVCATVLSSQQVRAQFTQQGPKLVGTGSVGMPGQGASVSLSADGNTAIVGGSGTFNNRGDAAAWVWSRRNGVWTQQGSKLVGSSAAVGAANQGFYASLSADGNTAIVGGPAMDRNGVAWIWTRNAEVWTQQGPKLRGSGAVADAYQGSSASLSADGNTAIVGGSGDNSFAGAAWVWTRSGGIWTQQGQKLVGSGAIDRASRGVSVCLSADGNTAIVGGHTDNLGVGAVWVWTRTDGVWTQQGPKLVGSGPENDAYQGSSVSLSADGNTAVVGGGGYSDNNYVATAWVWTRSGGLWTQQGPKLVGSGAMGVRFQGASVSLSADGNTAIVVGPVDNGRVSTAWIWTRNRGVWTQKSANLVGSGTFENAGYGSLFLSGDGNTVIVGTPADNNGLGAAWVFTAAAPVPPVAPTILTPFVSQTVKAGQNASFAVAATGTAPLSYQWRKNGANISGAFSDTLNLSAVTAESSGGYSVIVRNAIGTVVSTTAYLAVLVEGVAPVVVSGRVLDTAGKAVASATVTADLFTQPVASAQTDAGGNYKLPPLSAQIYKLSANLKGFVSESCVLPLSQTTHSQSFQLRPSPKPYQTSPTDGPPPVTYVPSPEVDEGSKLLIFDGTTFTDNLALLDRTKMLTVLTHGWNADPTVWALPMAKTMAKKGITANVNVVAWDWHGAAGRLFPLPEEKTSSQGIALGQSLQAELALGEGYAQPVHFIGHSLGTLVNRFAVDYLRGESTGTQPSAKHPWPGFRPHLTLFDEAEIAHLVGPGDAACLTALLFTDGNAKACAVVRRAVELYVAQHYGPDAPDWKRPIPKTPGASVWIDNYVSAFGRSRDEAFNVCLQFALPHDWTHLGHSYPQQWYQSSVELPTIGLAGFKHSYEQRLKDSVISGVFPPGAPLTMGTLFHQVPFGDELDVEPVPFYEQTECYFPFFLGAGLGNTARLTVETATIAKDIAVESIRIDKNFLVATYNGTTQALNTAYDYVGEKANGGVTTVWNFVTGGGPQIDMNGQQLPTSRSNAQKQGLPTASMPYGIVSLVVPQEADLFTFDYAVTGDSADGVVVFGIGTTNLFSQPQSVVPRGKLQTSPLFQVQSLAGGTNEFFFGLAETTTTNLTVRVQGFRFYTLQPPALTAEIAGVMPVLSWPSTANGYELESTTNLAAVAWTSVANPPTLLAGRFSVTNSPSDGVRFFRLRQP